MARFKIKSIQYFRQYGKTIPNKTLQVAPLKNVSSQQEKNINTLREPEEFHFHTASLLRDQVKQGG